jgi:hypothetical protein
VIRLKKIWLALRKSVMKRWGLLLDRIDPREPVEQIVIKKKKNDSDFDRLKFRLKAAREDEANGLYDDEELKHKIKMLKKRSHQ